MAITTEDHLSHLQTEKIPGKSVFATHRILKTISRGSLDLAKRGVRKCKRGLLRAQAGKPFFDRYKKNTSYWRDSRTKLSESNSLNFQSRSKSGKLGEEEAGEEVKQHRRNYLLHYLVSLSQLGTSKQHPPGELTPGAARRARGWTPRKSVY